MADIEMQAMEDLPEATEISDTDISILNTSIPQTKKFKIGTLLDLIKNRFTAWNFILKTSAQNVPSAIDELKVGVDEVNASLKAKITAEVKHVSLSSNWVILDKPNYYLLAAYTVRGDAANYVKGINKRYDGSGYAIIVDGANNVEVDLYLIWAKVM